MIQGECEKCEDRGETHGLECIVRKVIFNQGTRERSQLSNAIAMTAAVHAFEKHIQKKDKQMNQNQLSVKNQTTAVSNSLADKFGFTESQMELIRTKVAKGATDDELEMFFYQAKMLDANPLMPGEIYFVKFGNSPGTIITGIQTFRKHAHSTGKLAGVKRGVIRDAKGQCIGGWADVYRTDWKEPAHEEVALNEYHTGRGNWVKMPETMIKKVAEVAAYRMAFPKQLGGLYVSEEMDQAAQRDEEYKNRKPSDAQLKRLFAISKSNGYSNDEIRGILINNYGHDRTKDLTIEQYNELCAQLESKTVVVKKTNPIEPESLNEDAYKQGYRAGFDLADGASEVSKETEISEVTEPEQKNTQLPWEKYLPNQDPRMVK